MLEAGYMPACCWYEGYAKPLLKSYKKEKVVVKGYILITRDILLKFIHKKDTYISFIYPYDEDDCIIENDMLLPLIKKDNDSSDYLEEPYKIYISDIVILSHYVELMEEKNPELYSDMNRSFTVDFNSTNSDNLTTNEGSNSLKYGEKPLVGMNAIANYLGVSVSSIKNYRKKRGFPTFSQGGKKCAYPSHLDEWRQKNKK